jgi:hypothetical protein
MKTTNTNMRLRAHASDAGALAGRRFGRPFLGMPHPNSPAGRHIDWASAGVPNPHSPAGKIFDYWSTLGVPHPDSPAGRTFDYRATVGVPHPNSPAGRGIDWWNLGKSQIDSSAQRDFDDLSSRGARNSGFAVETSGENIDAPRPTAKRTRDRTSPQASVYFAVRELPVTKQEQFSINAFTKYLEDNTAGPPCSKAECATAIRKGLYQGGLKECSDDADPRQYPTDAKAYGPFLESMGFSQVLPSPPVNYSPQIGDIMVFRPVAGAHPSGHIQAWTGDHWTSDFKQTGPSGPWPNQIYKQADPQPSYKVYRWRPDGSYPPDPADSDLTPSLDSQNLPSSYAQPQNRPTSGLVLSGT